MTKTQKAKAQFILDMRNVYDLEQDRWGHFKIVCKNGEQWRIKLIKTIWRWEFKSTAGWTRIISAPYNKPTDSAPRQILHRIILKTLHD